MSLETRYASALTRFEADWRSAGLKPLATPGEMREALRRVVSRDPGVPALAVESGLALMKSIEALRAAHDRADPVRQRATFFGRSTAEMVRRRGVA